MKSSEFRPDIKLDNNSAIPLHHQIASCISKSIVRMRVPAGTKMPAERTLSKELDISRITVHTAYETLVHDSILSLTPGGRTYVVSAKISGKYNFSSFPNIGIIMPWKMSSYINKENLSTLDYFAGVMDEAAESDFSTAFVALPEVGENPENIAEWASNIFSRLSGLIYLGCRNEANDEATKTLLNENTIPQVFLTGTSELPHIASVLANYKSGISTALEHLREQGHKRVGVCSLRAKHDNPFFLNQANTRLNELLGLIKECGMEFKESWIAESSGDIQETEANLMNMLQNKNRPSALMCINDSTAFTVMKLLNKNRIKIPEDISVVGYDDISTINEITPKLTTVRQPRYLMGRKAVQLITELLQNGKYEEHKKVYIDTALVIRESTGNIFSRKQSLK